jgi:hypothetical protein
MIMKDVDDEVKLNYGCEMILNGIDHKLGETYVDKRLEC